VTRTVALVWLVSFSVPDPSGSLWVGAWRDRQVVRVDPRSNRVVARFPAGGRNPAGLAVGAGTNWVVHPDTDEVVRLELGTGRVVARIKLGPLPFQVAPGDDRFLPSLVAVGAGPDRLPAVAVRWPASMRPPTVSGRSSPLASQSAWPRPPVPSGSPTAAGRWCIDWSAMTCSSRSKRSPWSRRSSP